MKVSSLIRFSRMGEMIFKRKFIADSTVRSRIKRGMYEYCVSIAAG